MSGGPRRLAAIMFTDMVGFTSVAQRDESVAVRLLEEQNSVLRPLIAAHGGRVIKSMGDGLLIEFSSVVESVRCAQRIQSALGQRNAIVGDPEKILLRVGIHVGDILGQGDDIVGDAVNVASRLEPLADPGGICVSAQVIDQIRNKLPFTCQAVVAPNLKNVDFPIQVFRIVGPEDGGGPPAIPLEPGSYVRVAVLPFVSMSTDPTDQVFADGLTEELITHLAQASSLRVIARTSVMPYRGVQKGVREIGRELGVGSILEGSVRRSANTVRITVQLIDARTEDHLWADRFDRELTDIFAIQDEIARAVSKVLQGKLVTRTPPNLRNRRPPGSSVRGTSRRGETLE